MAALEILTADPSMALLAVSVLLTVALVLTQKKPKLANLDDALQSSATRGAYIPLLIGRHRIGPVFAFVDDSESHTSLGDSPNQPGFGKGAGSAPTPPSYWEDALHILCVGPGSRLMAIFENGETVFNADVSPDSNPSGSSFTLADGSTFQIYWGFKDDPILPRLGTSTRHGLNVRYPLTMKILWLSKNLGQSRQWPRLEYEVECPCYSQIAQSSSELPIDANDSLPTWESAGMPYVPAADRVQLDLIDVVRTSGGRTLLVLSGPVHRRTSTGGFPGYYPIPITIEHLSATLATFRQGVLVKVASPTPGSVINPTLVYSPSLGTSVPPSTAGIGSSSWSYFIVRKASLGAEIRVPADVSGTLTNIGASSPHSLVLEVTPAVGVPIDDLDPAVPAFLPSFSLGTISPQTFFNSGWVRPLETSGFDGVNCVHMVDQLLFAKFPYGAGKNRALWDSRSIEKAALILQEERIKGSIQVKDGEGVESVIATILQDCGMFMPWDPQTGLFLLMCIRHEDPDTAVDLPPEMILKSPEVVSVQGSRPVDVIAFTYRDRERNYREEPLVILDDGQISLSENQKARKVPIEVTTDGPSAGRLIPRRQQEVLANLQSYTFETNHASQMAFPGVRISAKATEGDGFIFRIVTVKRDVNSSKVVIKALLDCYDPPPLVPEEIGSTDSPIDSPPPRRVSDASSVWAFEAVEVPRMLSGGQIQILFPAARLSDRTTGAVVWASRDGSSYSVQGSCPAAICGFLDDPLPAGPCYDEAISVNVTSAGIDFDSIEDLTLSPDSWRAGRQLLIIGSEICFLQNSIGDTLQGLIRGRLGTVVQDHPAGTPFCVLLAHTATPLTSAMFLPGKTVSYKLQAIEPSKASSVDDAPSQDITIQGLAYKPLAPSALRLANLRPDYSVSDDITIRWCWHSNEFPRTGLGMQTLGAATGTSNPRGHFTFRILDGATVVLEGLTADPLFSLDVADRGTLGLDALSSWVFEVTAVEGSFSSAPVSLTLYPV